MHTSVFKNELCENTASAFWQKKASQDSGYFVDVTLGAGGHSVHFLENTPDQTHLISIDRDLNAIHDSKKVLEPYSERCKVYHCDFAKLKYVIRGLDLVGKVDGIMADFGVSSMQIDQAERGFSFMRDGPLDMRMDQSKHNSKPSVTKLLNKISEERFVQILFDYGEEPKARRIARGILKRHKQTPFTRTLDLAKFIVPFYHGSKSRKHPATRTFQALRIEVNNELDQIDQLITSSMDLLKPGGRLAVISFHSLEDRIVKKSFKRLAGKIETELSNLPISGDLPREAKIIKPFPKVPSEQEILNNSRARSAKLRVIEKI